MPGKACFLLDSVARPEQLGPYSQMESLRQPARLVILCVYLALLGVVSRISLGEWVPLSATDGLWLYGGLLWLLVGDLLVSPFFLKPADALSYAATALVALIAPGVAFDADREAFERILWIAGIIFAGTVLLVSLISMTFRSASSPLPSMLSRATYKLADAYGSPRVTYFVVFFLAILAFNRQSSTEFALLLGTGVVVTYIRPVEGAWLVVVAAARWRTMRGPGVVGELFARKEPGIMLVRQRQAADLNIGDLVVVRTNDKDVHFGLHLDWQWLAGEAWARIVRLQTPILTEDEAKSLASQAAGEGMVTRLRQLPSCQSGYEKLQQIRTVEKRAKLVGIVDEGTNLGTLWFEVTGEDAEIEEGQLVETRIRQRMVLYQVIDGVSKEEVLRERNSYGYARAKARKIGVWDGEAKRFMNVRWILLVNEPVLLVDEEIPEPDAAAIGYFPKTNFPVMVQLAPLVTHNTAILGILGSGKTYLALELTERMLREGIKVICLDPTGQYVQILGGGRPEAMVDKLKAIGRSGAKTVQQNVEDGGSIKQFGGALRECFREFLAHACHERLMILDPGEFEVWRQDSRPYQGNASMASLTPTEITRIVTEAALDCLRDGGTTDRARACIVFEEAHSLVPEWNSVAAEGDRTAVNGTARAILQGRKYGLGCLLITQRTANVTKSILNQCNTVFAMRTYDATGMEFLKNYIGEDFVGVLSTLENRHAIVFGRASSCSDPVLVRLNDREDFKSVFDLPPGSQPACQEGSE